MKFLEGHVQTKQDPQNISIQITFKLRDAESVRPAGLLIPES
jgi:hypothetical protein